MKKTNEKVVRTPDSARQRVAEMVVRWESKLEKMVLEAIQEAQERHEKLMDNAYVLVMADLMAQELQELVDAAQESSGSADALASTQALLEDWEFLRGRA